MIWGGLGWGLGAYTSDWGYGYYNPYYVVSSPSYVVYDYAQPVVVTTYEDPGVVPVTPANTTFDEALGLFRAGAYQDALPLIETALKQQPGDAVVHEIRALDLFALGQYGPAAATLNSLLTSAPGMDWTTMSGLYGNIEDYTAQLRALEAHCKANPNDAAAHFVLAYHYLVTGYQDDAVDMLRAVVAVQPKDVTAQRMLDALTTPTASTTPETSVEIGPKTRSPEGPLVAPPVSPAPQPGPETDLVGSWIATAGPTTIYLTISEDSKFVWTAKQEGKPDIVVSGPLVHTSDALEFDSKEQGAMVGSVSAIGPNEWKFMLEGAPTGDPGLTFKRSS